MLHDITFKSSSNYVNGQCLRRTVFLNYLYYFINVPGSFQNRANKNRLKCAYVYVGYSKNFDVRQTSFDAEYKLCFNISREERERNIDMPYIAHIYVEIYYNPDYYIDGKSICLLIWDCCRVWLTCIILSLFILACFVRVFSFLCYLRTSYYPYVFCADSFYLYLQKSSRRVPWQPLSCISMLYI